MTETDGIFKATIPLFAVFKTPLPIATTALHFNKVKI
jgi:hypothetical protein